MAQSLSYFDNHPQNLSSRERAISVILGLGLAASAARPRPNPWLSIAALVGGSYLAIRGATGRDPLNEVVQRLLLNALNRKDIAAITDILGRVRDQMRAAPARSAATRSPRGSSPRRSG